MTKKKVLSVIVVIAILLVTSLTVVACNPDGESLGLPKIVNMGKISDAKIDNENYTISFSVSYTTTSLNEQDVKFDNEDIPVQYDFYTDGGCTNKVDYNAYKLQVGQNVVYLKVELKDDAEVYVVYKVTITRRDKSVINPNIVSDVPVDVELSNTDYVKPQKSNITKSELFDVYAYFMAMVSVGMDDYDTIDEALANVNSDYGYDEETWDLVQEIASNSGLTATDARLILDSLKNVDDVVIEMIQAIESLWGNDGGPDALIELLTNEEKIACLLDNAKIILSVVDADMAITIFDEIMTIVVGDSVDLDSYSLSIYYLSYEDLLEKIAGNSYEAELRAYADAQYFETLYKSNELRSVVSGLIRFADSILGYDEAEIANVMEVALPMFLGDNLDIGAIFSSTSTISLKDTVKAVNTIGAIINNMLDAGEEDETFVPSALELLKILTNNRVDLPTAGVWELVRMVANLLEKVTVSAASEIYANVDDLQKANSIEADEKEGYLIASIAKFIEADYKLLSDSAKTFVLRLFDVEHTEPEFIDNLMALCLAKEDIDDLTPAELCAISAQFSKLVSDPDFSYVSYQYDSIFIPVGANSNQVLSLLVDANSKMESIVSNGQIKKVNCDTSSAGYVNVLVETTGDVNYRFTAFVYDTASLERFTINNGFNTYASIICIGLDKGDGVNDAFDNGSYSTKTGREQLYYELGYMSLTDTKAHRYHNLNDFITADDLIITGVDTSKGGWNLGMVSFEHELLSGKSIPFAYYVVDPDNRVMTNMYAYINEDLILVGDSLSDLSIEVRVQYDYNEWNYSEVSYTQATISGFNSYSEGNRTLTVSYAGFTDTLSYSVASTANYYNPENWELEIDSWDVSCSRYSSYETIDNIKHYTLPLGSYIYVDGASMRYNKNGISDYKSAYIYPNGTQTNSEIFASLGLTAFVDFDYSKANTESYTDCYAIITDAQGNVWHKELIGRYKLNYDYYNLNNWSFDDDYDENYYVSGNYPHDYEYSGYYVEGCNYRRYYVENTSSTAVEWGIYVECGDVRVNVGYYYGTYYYYGSGDVEEFFEDNFVFECDYDPTLAMAGAARPCHLILKDKQGNEIDKTTLFFYELC